MSYIGNTTDFYTNATTLCTKIPERISSVSSAVVRINACTDINSKLTHVPVLILALMVKQMI